MPSPAEWVVDETDPVGRIEGEPVEAASRARARTRRIFTYASASAGSQIVSLACSLATVPLLLHALGVDAYGHYVAFVSSVALTGALDLGIGSGVIALLASAEAQHRYADARGIIASAFFVLSILSGIGLGVSAAVFAVLGLSPGSPMADPLICFPIMGVFLSLALPLNLGARVLIARGQGWISAVGTAVVPVATLAILLANRSSLWFTSTAQVLVMTLGLTLLGMGATGSWCYWRLPAHIRPSREDISWASVRRILRSGSLYLVLGVAGLLGYNADVVVVASLLGGESAAQFGVASRLFGMATLFCGFLLAPLWPSFAEALAVGDVAWVRKTFLRSCVVASAAGAVWAVLCVAFGNVVLEAWTGGQIPPLGWPLMLALAVWTSLNGFITSIAMILNGANVIRSQVYAAASFAIANMIFSIGLTRTVGVSGPIWGSVIAQLFFTLPITLRAVRRTLRTPPARPENSGCDRSKEELVS